MTTTTLTETTRATIERMSGGSTGKRLGVREVAIAVEEAVGEEAALADIHAAILAVAAFYPSDDPQDPERARQWPFRMRVGNNDGDSRIWVYKR